MTREALKIPAQITWLLRPQDICPACGQYKDERMVAQQVEITLRWRKFMLRLKKDRLRLQGINLSVADNHEVGRILILACRDKIAVRTMVMAAGNSCFWNFVNFDYLRIKAIRAPKPKGKLGRPFATFEVNGYDHQKNNPECPACWRGFPVPCECGGLIHAEFGDENANGDYYLIYRCSKCDNYTFKED